MHLEGILTKADVYFIEKRPKASEYLLPEMDFGFITGSAFVNKTMPRLLELIKNAHTAVFNGHRNIFGCGSKLRFLKQAEKEPVLMSY